MELVNKAINAYVEEHTSPEPDYLYQLNRETNLKVSKPQMLSGQIQGKALKLISAMLRPEQVLEIGAYTGYATICLAEGLAEGGMVHTIDNNEELETIARRYWQKAGVEEVIRLYREDATKMIPRLDNTFDLVFIDADKENYETYYDQVFDKVRKGGIILADNVLWSGKVLQEDPDKETAAIQAFNKKVQADNRVENVILTVRDGLMMVRKL
jgi:predicted O-methyltransferase YrrM